ncbi:MAG: hypothetical protein QNJ12_22070 [Ilumatobacter sp.]|uniref:hypothetical protein n=1 Tax=Ilumatobacter sp. TaxID=1967498 RepID=UPI00262D3518|nr:hypothetical protein [Ilumatobacter sp.]MDJ0771489.1 hypothetical protein [Ilumatobacter sp.]
MGNRPSGMPGDRAFPHIGREYEYTEDVARTGAAIRSVRLKVGSIAALIAVLGIVLLIAGKGATATGVIGLLGVPMLLVLAINEIVAFFHRRRS